MPYEVSCNHLGINISSSMFLNSELTAAEITICIGSCYMDFTVGQDED